jgi:hypothetical protein
MKNKIIRITDISDIDTSKISVYDLNNRYIDMRGNMYSLRYNKVEKTIEIIKIMRTHAKDASYYHQKVLIKKMENSRAPAGEGTEDFYGDDESPSPKIGFDPDIFINDSINLMATHRDRLKGIMMNLKNSNIVTRENKSANTELEDIFRNIDIDGIQNFEKAENYQKELINYPRSITYYQAKIDRKGREIIESLAGYHERIMKFVYVYEMFNTIKNLYRSLNVMVKNLDAFINRIDQDQIKSLTQMEKQYFNDARVSIDNTISEVEDILDGLKVFEGHVYDKKNF